jgi:hypothetical protein
MVRPGWAMGVYTGTGGKLSLIAPLSREEANIVWPQNEARLVVRPGWAMGVYTGTGGKLSLIAPLSREEAKRRLMYWWLKIAVMLYGLALMI